MAGAIDSFVSPIEQQEWLNSGSLFGSLGVRAPQNTATAVNEDRLQLLTMSEEWPFFALFLRLYIEEGIIKPFETQPNGDEIGWWNVTIGQGATQVRINIWRQYVATFDFRAEPEGEFFASGELYLDKQTIEAALSSGEVLADTISVTEVSLVGNRRPLIGLFLRRTPVETYEQLFSKEWFVRAIRLTNLDLMHGGQLSLGRRKHHVAKLVDAVFAEDIEWSVDGESKGEVGADNSVSLVLDASDPEVQALAWRRCNTAGFVQPVLARFGHRCAISGVEAPELLQACHIKPWKDADAQEKLDPENGVCLAAHLHYAFDAHLIGIRPDGCLVLSDRLKPADRERLNLSEGYRVPISSNQRAYLEYRFSKFLQHEQSMR